MKKLIVSLSMIFFFCSTDRNVFLENAPFFEQALENGQKANQAFVRCHRFVKGWLNHTDPVTGLIPKNLKDDKDIWNAQDSAADNYPFMVLTAAITDRPLFKGKMLDMLRTEMRLTSRMGNLPDTYSFSKGNFLYRRKDMQRIIFGASEYIKDGLLPLTEWLGPSPWSERMIAMTDDIVAYSAVETPAGYLPSDSHEVNGELLQTLSRLYWMTGEDPFLDKAIQIGDYYMFYNHPTKTDSVLRLRDHGCEIVSGLTELYATLSVKNTAKKNKYKEPMHQMLDRILKVGRNEHGLFYNQINPITGEHSEGLADTFGYNLNGFYTVYLIDNKKDYRQATLFALSNLRDHYQNYNWENGSADGYADAIEGALNLYNREPLPSTKIWIDTEIQYMWNIQKPDGIIEGWHGDGNFARTSIMYALWKTKGLTITPWDKNIVFGAKMDKDNLYITLYSDKAWQTVLMFDKPRHRLYSKLPFDYPRINQFPEWFTAEPDKMYSIFFNSMENQNKFSGQDLINGIPVQLEPGTNYTIFVKPL